MASVQRLSLTALLLVLVAIYFTHGNYTTRANLNHARQHFGNWLLCDLLEEDYRAVKGLTDNAIFRLPTIWKEPGRPEYYEGLGEVVIRHLGDSYEVRLRQSDLVVPDIQPWVTSAGSTLTVQAIFEPLPDPVLELIEFSQDFIRQFDPADLEGVHPGYLDPLTYDPLFMSILMEKRQHLRQLQEFQRAFGTMAAGAPENPVSGYKELERQVYSARVQVPFVDNLALRPGHALLLIAGCVLLMAARVRRPLLAVSVFEHTGLAAIWIITVTVVLPAVAWACCVVAVYGAWSGGDTLNLDLAFQILVLLVLAVFVVINVISSVPAVRSIRRKSAPA